MCQAGRVSLRIRCWREGGEAESPPAFVIVHSGQREESQCQSPGCSVNRLGVEQETQSLANPGDKRGWFGPK